MSVEGTPSTRRLALCNILFVFCPEIVKEAQVRPHALWQAVPAALPHQQGQAEGEQHAGQLLPAVPISAHAWLASRDPCPPSASAALIRGVLGTSPLKEPAI